MLNLSLPYGTVHGHEHAVYFQNGKHYNASKDEIELETGKIIKKYVPPKVSVIDAAVAEAAPKPIAVGMDNIEAPAIPTAPSEGVIDLDNAHWQTLKKIVIDAGGEYVDKEQAIAYLRSM